jgi:hypothetical protein
MNMTLTNLIRLEALTLESGGDERDESLQAEMDRLRGRLSEGVLRRFDDRLRYGRRVVAPLSETGACGSCHLKLPLGNAMQVRREEAQMLTCPFCGCFLYAPAAPEPAAQPFPPAAPAPRRRVATSQVNRGSSRRAGRLPTPALGRPNKRNLAGALP